MIAGEADADYNDPMGWDMIGHGWAQEFLQEQLEREGLHHAYLLTGPDGVGKGTLGQRLAEGMLCERGPGAPCRACRTCQLVDSFSHPDLHRLAIEGRGGTIKVEEVREMQRQISLAPYQADRHVVLVLGAHDLTRAAANALLKTLEEPPARAVLILTARSPEALLPTLVSRCEHLRLRPVPRELIAEALSPKHGREQAQLLSALASGRPGVALQLAEDEEALDRRRADVEALFEVIRSDRIARFRMAKEWAPNRDRAAERDRILRALGVWLSMWRDVMLLGCGAEVPLGNPDQAVEIGKLAEKMTGREAAAAVEATVDAMSGILRNANLQLALEGLLLKMPADELMETR